MKKINKHLHSQIVHQKTRKKTQRVQKENEMHIRIKTMYRTHSLTQLSTKTVRYERERRERCFP
jgi:hypothetical protein